MKTYRQEKNATPFNWPKFLERGIAGKVKDTEQTKAATLAGDWVTCACGNQCSILERDSDGEPTDGRLSALGMDFYVYVSTKKYDKAQATLENIEKRSKFLIAKKVTGELSALGYSKKQINALLSA